MGSASVFLALCSPCIRQLQLAHTIEFFVVEITKQNEKN
jgi:hypothetical protein